MVRITPTNMQVIVLTVLVCLATCQWNYFTQLTMNNDVNEVSFSPDGTRFIVATESSQHCMVSFVGFAQHFCYNAPSACLSAKFSPNGNYLAFGLQNGKIHIRNGSNHPTYPAITNISTNFNPVY